MPLLEHKEIPRDSSLFAKTQFIEGHGRAYFEAVKAQALEGIVLKRKDSRYEVGKRSHSWLKVVNYQYAEVFVVGFRKTGDFGLLLTFDDGRYAGVMELGTNPVVRKQIYSNQTIREEKDFAYIEPVKCFLKYRNLTKAGKLRLPSFVEWV